jgi:hypothetical protein
VVKPETEMTFGDFTESELENKKLVLQEIK